MYEHYLGVDLHKRRTYLVLMDAQVSRSVQESPERSE
jgi:hypothetical protein